ncbi:MAG: acyl-CoA desaturase [Cyclobacteriaceae bacterium]|nr:acyl-CoA desaturase [Cyclobacteriaceae bacterium]
MIRYKFANETDQEFASTLKKRVNDYFKDNNLSKNANKQMIIKTVIAMSVYLVPFFIMIFGNITQIPLLFALWIAMGFGKCFIGTSVMHDTLHGSYSKNKTVNFLMGISVLVLGIAPSIWKIQHNVLHHTYTNIEHADEDIQPRFVLRFTPNQPRRWFHRYQHIYSVFFYGLLTLVWVVIKDFFKLIDYKKKGLVKSGASYYLHHLEIVGRKIIYFAVFLALPIYILPIPVWMTVVMFITMHFVTGVMLSLIFQTAHVIPSSDFIEQEEEKIERNFSVHQILTTSNYAMNNKFLTWCIGGLNFQVEHHLFPSICHVHYASLSKIVQQTTKEFNLPYHSHHTFGAAINSHFKQLKDLGRG